MNLDDIRDKAVITVTDCARLLDMDERSVRRGIEQGEIPAIRVGRRILVAVPHLLRMLEGGAPPPGPERLDETPTQALLRLRSETAEHLARLDHLIQSLGLDSQ